MTSTQPDRPAPAPPAYSMESVDVDAPDEDVDAPDEDVDAPDDVDVDAPDEE